MASDNQDTLYPISCGHDGSLVGFHGYTFAQVYGQNREWRAAFIVRACNAHDDLLAACKRIADGAYCRCAQLPTDGKCPCAARLARAAIAKAQPETRKDDTDARTIAPQG